MGFSQAESQQSTSTNQVDKRITTTSGNITAIQDSPVTVRSGGTVNLTSSDPQVAAAAINAVANLASNLGESTASAVKQLAQGSNRIAADVAASQEKFVATASGQKYVLWALVGVVGVLMLPSLLKGGKSTTIV